MTRPLHVYTTIDSEAVRQDAAPEDIHQCNQPMKRRQKILHELIDSALNTVIKEVSSSSSSSSATSYNSLDLAKSVHNPSFIDFLRTVWDDWCSLPERCHHFFGPKVAGSEVPSLLPGGNFTNRDSCQSPGTGVYSRVCYYLADNEAPIYEALLPALVADMRIIEQIISNFDANNPKYCSYALITHPGHHASYETCQGYCYINSAAIIAQELIKPSKKSSSSHHIKKVAIVDVDYHCGNGTIGIFWENPDVLVCSIHAHPDIEYPYTTGFENQIGGGSAIGSTMCVPLPQGTTWTGQYANALDKVIAKVKEFGADAMVVSLGLDTLIDDPVAVVGAGFALQLDDYIEIGKALKTIELPSVFVQEGGYDVERVGAAVANTMRGFCS